MAAGSVVGTKGRTPAPNQRKSREGGGCFVKPLKDGSEGKPGDPGSRRRAEAAVILTLCTSISRAPEGLQPEMSFGEMIGIAFRVGRRLGQGDTYSGRDPCYPCFLVLILSTAGP